MQEYELIYSFQRTENKLYEMGYSVSAIQNGFYIHNKKGTIVADCKTVDGLRGFLQGLEWAQEANNGQAGQQD